jgi:hypothetical protein
VGMEVCVTNLSIVFISRDVECIPSGNRACSEAYDLFQSESGALRDACGYVSDRVDGCRLVSIGVGRVIRCIRICIGWSRIRCLICMKVGLYQEPTRHDRSVRDFASIWSRIVGTSERKDQGSIKLPFVQMKIRIIVFVYNCIKVFLD